MTPAFPSRRALLLSALAALSPITSCAGAKRQDAPPAPLFTDAEREAVRTYWNAPGRYAVRASDMPPRLNITVAGSLWYWNFLRLPPDPARADWWKLRFAHERAKAFGTTPLPDNPGAFVGVDEPPALYETVQPTRYTVMFEGSPTLCVYEDGIDFGKRPAYYAYYRQTNGVIRPGVRVSEATGAERDRLDALFAKAGRTAFERRVLQAVSRYEGGFEAINTYDTGFVSIGFLQFITAADGTGSLTTVLQAYKTADPVGFEGDFRRFGIDVAASPTVLVCVDPVTGVETRGADAVIRVINDKRLTAVFERAAAFEGFRLAQVSVARSRYYPAEDVFVIGNATVRVGDIVKSEAGMATLMDKKVNKGNIREFAEIGAKIMAARSLSDPLELSKYEREIIQAMKYRGDFLADKTLSQPPALPGVAPAAPPTPIPIRKR
ncbi:MAG: hypothetical protein H7Y38_10585 [Armatimonadetes bacterium]|nr:hypothetical protein [Armatimonadota bacterium]